MIKKTKSNESKIKLITIIHFREKDDRCLNETSKCMINDFILESDDIDDILLSVRVSDVTVLKYPKKYDLSPNDILFLEKLNKSLTSLVVCYESCNSKKLYDHINKDLLGGNSKVCNTNMLSVVVKTMKTQRNSLVMTRPFIISKKIEIPDNEDYVLVEGYLRNGMVGDTVIVNGKIRTEIIDCRFDNEDDIYSGKDLIVSLSGEERLFTKYENFEKDSDDDNVGSYDKEVDFNDISTNDDDSNDLELDNTFTKEIPCTHNLELFEGMKPINEIVRHSVADSPEIYKNLIFLRDRKLLESRLKKLKNRFINYSKIQIRLVKTEELVEEIQNNDFFVLFNLWKYENYDTICNYQTNSSIDSQVITVNTGFSKFVVSNYFKSQNQKKSFNLITNNSKKFSKGTISFIGKIVLFSSTATLIGETCELSEYESKNSEFLISKTFKGYPIKYSKEKVTVKYMFCCRSRTKMYLNLELTTKSGNTGIITRTQGTKGLFKAKFTNIVKHGDEIYFRLYKPIFLNQ